MRISWLFQGSSKSTERGKKSQSRGAQARRQLFLEGLEQRALLTTAWGIDHAKIFSMADYTQIGAGSVAAGLTVYPTLKYQNAASGSLASLQPQMKAFALDQNGIAYMSYHGSLTFTDGQPTVNGPVLLKIDTASVTTSGPNVVSIIGSIPIGALNVDAIHSLSFDPISGNLFGTLKTTGADHLVKISTTTANIIADIGPMAGAGAIVDNAEDIEFDELGNLYVSDQTDDHLYQVNPATAAIISIVDNNVRGGLGLPASAPIVVEALGWDPTLDRLVAIEDDANLFFILTLDNGNNIPLGVLGSPPNSPSLDSPSSIKFIKPKPKIDIEKTTDGSPNDNPTDSNFDNEDGPNGAGVPVLTPGTAVTWTYQVTNTGVVTIPLAQVTVTDSVTGVSPVCATPDFLGDSDDLLEPGEKWKYIATGTVLDLGGTLPAGVTTVTGCTDIPAGTLGRKTYVNTGTVSIPGATDSDLSHYCNPAPQIDIEKTTDGSPNDNPTDSNFDNEDIPNGTGVPVLTPGSTVTWTYQVTNTGVVTIPLAQVTVTDSVTGVSPVRATPDILGDSDDLLEPGEKWKYIATGTVLDLGGTLPAGVTTVTGCTNIPDGTLGRKTYVNTGTVSIPGATDSDLSHYCNPAPQIDIEKTTDGLPNDNPTDSNFDNEDVPNGTGVPVLTPGSTVTWTYQVTNTGVVTIPLAQVTVTDSVTGVSPVRATPDFLGDSDDLLEPGEKWKYIATGTVLDLGGTLPAGVTTVTGCTNIPDGTLGRKTYVNTGTVTIPGDTDSDLSHYCNPAPQIDIEKTTDGLPNDNPTDSNFDNEDVPNGTGVPVLTPGSTVTWTYQVTNTGVVTIPLAQVTVTDSVTGVNPVRATPDILGDSDDLLEPGEKWKYIATGTVLDLGGTLPAGVTTVTGCTNIPAGTLGRKTYVNTGTVTIPGDTDSDLSHYCNPAPQIDIEKTTDGSPNGNSTDSDFDNEDIPNGVGVPVLTPGTAVTWTYQVTNTGVVTIPLAQVTVTDSVPGVTPARVLPDFDGDEDDLLEPGEKWKYTATGTVLDLSASLPVGVTTVTGCTNIPVGAPGRNTYVNIGTVTIPGDTDSDPSHYCNPPPGNPGIDIEKKTNGPTNSNPTAPDFDNEDAENGPGVPILTPGSTVTWTYKVTNTGNVPYAANQVVVVDDNGTPANTADDLSTTNGKITFQSVQTGDSDTILEPGEVWLYQASGIVQDVGTTGPAVTFNFSGSSALDGPDGNIRTFTAGGISVKASAFSRSPAGAWTTAFLGSYPGGLGVTDAADGTGANNAHTVDNLDSDNFVLFELSQGAVIDSAFLGYVVDDSDLRLWIGNVPNAFNNHQTLSDAFLTGLGFTEVNETTLTTTRLADLNASGVSGNVIVIAANTGEPTTEDKFKIEKMTVGPRDCYENKGVVTVPGDDDSDLSHYCNPPRDPGIDIEKTTNGPTNSNPTTPDFDNEDAANGPGVPILTPGSTVTWTYKVTNTGNVPFAFNEVVVVDDNGTPANASDDLSTTNGKVTFQSVQTGDADNILEPGEVWLYKATGTVQTLVSPGAGSPSTFDFTGSTAVDGPDGNIRTFTAGSISVKASAFSRDESTGAWSTAFLGSYGGGLGVTDTSESGANNTHTVDNLGGRDNYVLFEFSQNVVVDSAFLGYVVTDSDLTVWIGTKTDPFNNHLTLSDSVLGSLGFTEVNLTDLTTTRLADLNAGNIAGNVLIIAAYTDDTSPEDQFKIETVTVKPTTPGVYENKAVVTVPGDTDSDPSHYKNPAPVIPVCVEIPMTGNSATTGTKGNIRQFDIGNVSVKASAFSRTSTGTWGTAYLGSYAGGLGVTDSGETGVSPSHTVDNVGGRNNYVLFEFSQPVTVDKALLGFVVTDSDLSVWIGTKADVFNSHLTLSDAVLTSLGFTEVNLTDLSTTRTADLNAGNHSGNVLVIAGHTADTTPDDQFKIANLNVCTPGGTKFYVVNDSTVDKNFRYTAAGTLDTSNSLAAGNNDPRGVATTASGTPVWVVDMDKNVYVYDANGNPLGSWTARKTAALNADVSNSVQGVATDGTNIWIVDDATNEVFFYAGGAAWRDNAVPRNATSKFALNTANVDPRDITFGTITVSGVTKQYLWVVNDTATADKVFRYELNAANGVQAVVSWTINAANSKPTGITVDPSGASQDIWIVDDGATTDKVYRYANGKSLTTGTAPAAASWTLAAGNSTPQGIADPKQIPIETKISYTNPNVRFDVNGDGFVTPADVLFVFNRLNNQGPGLLPTVAALEGEESILSAFYDVNADGLITSFDALQVINYLNGPGIAVGPGTTNEGSGTDEQPDDGDSSDGGDVTAVVDAVMEQVEALGTDDSQFPISDSTEELQQVIDELFGDGDLFGSDE